MYLVQRKSKYGNKSTVFDGRVYHSKFEAGVAKDLELAKHAVQAKERVVKVTPQYRIKLKVNGHHICDYLMDFFVEYADGHQEFIEVKGFETMLWRYKWKLLEAIAPIEYPGIDLRIIK